MTGKTMNGYFLQDSELFSGVFVDNSLFPENLLWI